MKISSQQSLSHSPITLRPPEVQSDQTTEQGNTPCEEDGSLNLSVFLAGTGKIALWGGITQDPRHECSWPPLSEAGTTGT